MSQTQCCPVMDLQWTPRLVDDQYADVYFCASCGHVHRTEKYAINFRFPYHDRCVNCGGDLRLTVELPQGQAPDPRQVRCTACGLTAAEDRELHDKLAALHPAHDYLLASQALAESGRFVLSLKLATAQVRWGEDPVSGEVQRLAVLEAMNEFDRALDEAYEWSDNEGCPPLVFGVIAQLEAGVGNLKGALTALERGLAVDPSNSEWWVDYAELNIHLDERPGAIRAAGKALGDPSTEQRAIAVISEVGERYYAGGQYAEALGACSLARERQERFSEIAWLRARIAAVNQDTDYMVKWLQTTLELDPTHEEAAEMLAPYRKRRGWFAR
ncbi:MAG: tetratricopeptide repeat protein [Myxococcales bacterium]|nr:tetratricopeptide repeat protein [Myxococcales bacterium]